MIDYRFTGRLTYLPGGPLSVNMSAWPAGGINTTGLVSWWSLDETSGTRNDSHGTNHLTDVNTVLYATGVKSNAGDFEYSNTERLSISDNASLSVSDQDFSVACWVKFESGPDVNGGRVMVAHGEWTTKTGWFLMWHRTTGDAINNFRFTVYSSPTETYVLGPSPSIDTWYFVTAWHDATAQTINIQVNNGEVFSTSHTAGVDNTAAMFHLGAMSMNSSNSIWSAGYMDGLLDEVSFWKRLLTPDERTWLYNDGAGRDYSEL